MTINLDYGYIYKITINNTKSSMHECYYIGQHKYSKTKYKDNIYYGSGSLIQKYIKKWGTEGLIKEIICECKNEKELNQKEKEFIGDLYLIDAFSNGGKCLNLCSGGLNKTMSIESRQKMSEFHKGKSVSEETKRKIKNTLKGKFKGKNSFIFGYHHTKEAKEKIKKFQTGKIFSESTKLKLRNSHLGKPLSEMHIQKLKENHANFKGKNNPAFGRHWFTNGVSNIFTYECPEGFKPGMTRNRGNKK